MDTTISKCAPRRTRMVPLRALGPASMVLCLIALPALSASLPRFEMTAVVDVPGGEQIVRSDYAAAVDIITNAPRTSSNAISAFQFTNLCVAHTMTRQSAAAVQSCNEAIERERSRWNSRETRTERHAKLAWAHTNRAVALWMAGDRAAAEIDLAKAISYAPRDKVVKANAAAFAARLQPVASARVE